MRARRRGRARPAATAPARGGAGGAWSAGSGSRVGRRWSAVVPLVACNNVLHLRSGLCPGRTCVGPLGASPGGEAGVGPGLGRRDGRAPAAVQVAAAHGRPSFVRSRVDDPLTIAPSSAQSRSASADQASALPSPSCRPTIRPSASSRICHRLVLGSEPLGAFARGIDDRRPRPSVPADELLCALVRVGDVQAQVPVLGMTRCELGEGDRLAVARHSPGRPDDHEQRLPPEVGERGLRAHERDPGNVWSRRPGGRAPFWLLGRAGGTATRQGDHDCEDAEQPHRRGSVPIPGRARSCGPSGATPGIQ